MAGASRLFFGAFSPTPRAPQVPLDLFFGSNNRFLLGLGQGFKVNSESRALNYSFMAQNRVDYVNIAFPALGRPGPEMVIRGLSLPVPPDVAGVVRLHFGALPPARRASEVPPDVSGACRLHFGAFSPTPRAPQVPLDLFLAIIIGAFLVSDRVTRTFVESGIEL